MCSDAPDPDERIGQAAMENAMLSKEALRWYMAEYELQKPRQAELNEVADEVAQENLTTIRDNNDRAGEQWDRYKQKGIPTEDAMYRDAMEYDSPARKEAEAARAGTDIAAAMEQSRQATDRDMSRTGVNPNSAKYQAIKAGTSIVGALGTAGAKNNARKRVDDMGIMLRKDAAGFGRGMTTTAAAAYGVGSNAGQGATSALTSALGTANQGINTAGQGYTTAIAGNNSAGQILNSQYATQVRASEDGGTGAALIGAAGSIGAAY